MVQLALQHGISKNACAGFSFLSYVLCLRNDKASHQFGKSSLMLLKKTEEKELLPMSCFSVCASSNACNASIHSSIKISLKSCRTSLELSNAFYSRGSADFHATCSFYAGMNLSLLEDFEKSHDQSQVKMSTLLSAFLSYGESFREKRKQSCDC